MKEPTIDFYRNWESQGISEKTEEFCNGPIDECYEPKIPNCEDRTILCLTVWILGRLRTCSG